MYQVNHYEGREIPVHEGSKIDWVRGENRGLVDASTLGRPMAAYLYNDAYDIGFAVRSHKTNQVVVFTMTDELRDRIDGEVLDWVFTSDTDPQISIRVFND